MEPSIAASQTTEQLCRLCVEMTSDGKSLYDENGRANELYEITYKYFHPKIVNLEEARHLRAICWQCWRHICDFHSFQTSVLVAQLKLIEEKVEVETTTPKDDEEVVTIPEPMDADDENQMSESQAAEKRTSESQASEMQMPESETVHQEMSADTGATLPASLPSEIIILDSDSEFSADDELPLATYAAKAQANKQQQSCSTSSIGSPAPSSPAPQGTHERLDDLLAKWIPNIKCIACPMSYTNVAVLRNHFRLKHPNEEFYISCCSQKLATRRRLKDHLLLHNDPNAFKCVVCGNSFSVKSSLKIHMAEQHPEYSKFVCKICDKNCKNKTDLKMHYCTAHKIEPEPKAVLRADGKSIYPCSKCEKICQTLISLYHHFWFTHKLENSYVCTVCRRGFPNARDLREHMAEHQGKYLYRCAFCEKKFQRLALVAEHRNHQHRNCSNTSFYYDIEEMPVGDQTTADSSHVGALKRMCYEYVERSAMDLRLDSMISPELLRKLQTKCLPTVKCEFCAQTFPKLALLQDHFVKQHPRQKFHITCCSLKLWYPFQMAQHLLRHYDSNNLTCVFCLNSFTAINSLITHKRSLHNVSHVYRCQSCDASFVSKFELKFHYKEIHNLDVFIATMQPTAVILPSEVANTKQVPQSTKRKATRRPSLSPHDPATLLAGRSSEQRLQPTSSSQFYQSVIGKADKRQEESTRVTRQSVGLLATPSEPMGSYNGGNGEAPLQSDRVRGERLTPPVENEVSGIAVTTAREPTTSSCSSLDALEISLESATSSLNKTDSKASSKTSLEYLLAKRMPSLKCALCPQSFTHLPLLQNHFIQQHPEEEFHIVCCSEKLRKRDHIRNHLILRHGETKNLKCKICEKILPRVEAMVKHRVRVHGLKKYSCDFCDAEFNLKYELTFHLKCDHCIISDPQESKPEEKLPSAKEIARSDTGFYYATAQVIAQPKGILQPGERSARNDTRSYPSTNHANAQGNARPDATLQPSAETAQSDMRDFTSTTHVSAEEGLHPDATTQGHERPKATLQPSELSAQSDTRSYHATVQGQVQGRLSVQEMLHVQSSQQLGQSQEEATSAESYLSFPRTSLYNIGNSQLSILQRSQVAEQRPPSAEQRPQAAVQRPQSAEQRPQSAEQRPQFIEQPTTSREPWTVYNSVGDISSEQSLSSLQGISTTVYNIGLPPQHRIQHAVYSEGESSFSSPSPSYVQTMDNGQWTNSNQLQEPRTVAEPPKYQYTCTFCSMPFENLREVLQHCRTTHSNENSDIVPQTL